MSERVRPIHIPGATALASLRQRVHEALVGWSREWVRGGGDGETLDISISSPPRSDSSNDYEVIRNVARCLWFRCGAQERADVGRAVVGAELMPRGSYADEWIADIVDRARRARNIAVFESLLGEAESGEGAPSMAVEQLATRQRDLAGLPQSDVGSPPAHLFAVGSGAVQVSCPSLGLQAIASAAVWKAVPPLERGANIPPLMPLDRAAESASMRLDVLLGSVEVELPTLLDLNPGDILRLPRRLTQPLDVTCNGRYVARAVFGAMAGRKCVQLLDHS